MSRIREDAHWYRLAEELGSGQPAVPELARVGGRSGDVVDELGGEADAPSSGWFGIDVPVVAESAETSAPSRARRLGVFLLGAGALAFVLVLGSFAEGRSPRLGAALAHVLLTAAAIVVTACLRELGIRSPRRRAALEPWRQFLRGWTLLWGAWLMLYAGLALFWTGGSSTTVSPALEGGVSDALNLLSAWAFLYLFLVLDLPSTAPRNRSFRRAALGTGALCASAGALALAGRAAGGLLGGLGPLLGSLVVSVSMTYFFAALAARRVGRLAMAPLYLYVGLQVTWAVLVVPRAGIPWSDAEHEVVAAAVLWGAFALKLYLFALVTLWIRRESLQDYFDGMASRSL